MVSLTSKRPAAFDREPDNPRKRHASTDIVLNKDALTLYLARTQNTLEDLVHKHNDLASKHNALASKHDKLEDEVTDLQDEVAKVRRSPSTRSVVILADLSIIEPVREGVLQKGSHRPRPENRGERRAQEA